MQDSKQEKLSDASKSLKIENIILNIFWFTGLVHN